MIGSWITSGGFPSKFSKCCFHRFIRSCWLVAFRLVFAVLFILLTSFIACHAILDWLLSTESLILWIRFCMHSFWPFSYMLANSCFAFLSFWALVLVGFFLFHLEAVFTSARFSLTANVSHGTLYFVLSLVGMNSAAASRWALTKFLCFSFGVGVFVCSCRSSYVFLSANLYLSLISQLLSRTQSWCTVLNVRGAFFHWLSRIFWRDDSAIGGPTLAIHCTIFPFLAYKYVVYLCFSIFFVCVGPWFTHSFLKVYIEAC